MKFHGLLMIPFILLACGSNGQGGKQKDKNTSVKLVAPKGKAIAAFAEGCFWCTEHVFEAVAGVDSAVSGYAGGKTVNPTYEEVCTETTGHAETTLVYYDPKVVSYRELVEVFFDSHDPTTLNRQGPDVGSSYRSAIFYQTDEEKTIIQNIVKKLTLSKRFSKPIVTEISPLKAFYRAEEEHQNFIKQNPLQPYVRGVSNPRFEQFKRKTQVELKKGE